MKTSQRVNYRVVVEPSVSRWWKYDPKVVAADCEDIASQIKRHVDSVGYVHIEFDVQENCSFCGAAWTEESSVYNGGCCREDVIKHDAAEAVVTFFGRLVEDAA